MIRPSSRLSQRRARLAQCLATALGFLILVPVGSAHGPEAAPGVGYVSTVGGVVPNVLGVQARVLGGDDRLRIANLSTKTIEIEGYEGEPYLRIGPNGVYANERSPATFLNVERDPVHAYVPRSADATAPPRWVKVAAGSSYEWHDHRIHWTGEKPPPAVQTAPDEQHLIRNWRVPAQVDGQHFAITGFLGYVPRPAHENGTRWWPFAVGIGAAVLVAAAIGLGARRAKRRTP